MMKKIKFIITCFALISFLACDQEDEPFHRIYDNVNGQTGIGFTTTNGAVIVPVGGQISTTLNVQATTISSSARSFNVSVDTDASVGDSGDYSIGTITIPADSYNGSLDVTFSDDDLVDLEAYSLVLKLDVPDGIAVVGSDTATISYNRYLICNDVTLTLVEDGWGSERNWEITDSTGAVVAECADYGCPFGNNAGEVNVANFYLDDGCYTFTIYDSYGDGQADGVNTGSYSLTCSIINLAYGEGSWGFEESTDFCINP